MHQVHADPNVPQLQVMRKQVSRILQRFSSKRYGITSSFAPSKPEQLFMHVSV